MKKSLLVLLVLFFAFTSTVGAHSGRTDSSGGHNCSEKSKAKGLCTGYHYHNGGKASTITQSNKDSANTTVDSSVTLTKKEETVLKPQYETSSTTVYMNEQMQNLTPIIYEGSTYLPLRQTTELFDATVQYDANTKSIKINTEDKQVSLIINSKKVFVDGVQLSVDNEPIIIDSAVYIPIRSLSELLEWNVNYIKAENAIYITK